MILWWGMGCLVLLLAACLPQGVQIPESPLLRALERKSGLISYVGLDGNIYTIDQGGGNQTGITSDAKLAGSSDGKILVYQYPTWSPTERRLALVAVRGAGETVVSASIFIADVKRKTSIEAFRSETDYPFYLYWSPDGNMLSFLAASTSGNLSLWSIPAQGGEAQQLGSGRLIYWSWSPDNRDIIIHSAEADADTQATRLDFVHMDGGIRHEAVELQPSQFLAPAWSPLGEDLLLAAETAEGSDGLLLVNSQGMVKQVLAEFDGSVAFAWAPDGQKLAFLDRAEVVPQPADQLKVLDPQKPDEITTVDQEGAVGFFWSPDSKKIAFFVPEVVTQENETQGAAQRVPVLNAYVFDVRRGTSELLIQFVPTEHFASLFPFFDQYQRSTTIWSPDSQRLVISAYDGEGNPGIYILDVSGRLEFRHITQGQLAYWSWK
jgi:Tol biopolymer transport system component